MIPSLPARRIRPLAAILTPLLLILAGCGGGGPSSNPSNGTLTISPGTTTIDTNGSVPFKATLANGQPATGVNWTVSTGTNDSTYLGEGTIDSSGNYIPPYALSQDSVKIQVQASLASDPYHSVTAVVTVTPGIVSLVPETATVATGGTLKLATTIAEYGGGSVNWGLSNSATATSGASGAGSVGGLNCQSGGSIDSSNPYMTTCTATYTAPSSVPSQALFAVASVASNPATTGAARLLLNGAGLNTSPLTNQAVQTGAVQMGTSGGNNNDVDVDSSGNVTDCASGTLGALVQDQSGNLYILSNNHVLADSDQGQSGDTIIQPGLVDTGCTQLGSGVSGITAVGTLQYWVPIAGAANVDAALAATSSSNVDASGAILALGAAGGGSSQIGAAPPAAGTGEVLTAANLNTLSVAKSGRTTGLTCSTVDSIDVTVKVNYYKDAAETQFYYAKTFTNQISITGSYFSDSGDSGSLVVDTSNAQPVGLFYAGTGASSDGPAESIAQPIGDVLTELVQYSQVPTGTVFTVVGGAPHPVSCLNYDANSATPAVAVSAARMSAAEGMASGPAAAMVNPSRGILGVAAGRSLDEPGQAAVVVYVDQARAAGVAVPQTIGGLPTRVVPTTAAAVAAASVPTSTGPRPGIHLSQAVLDAAKAVHAKNAGPLMSDPAFFGVGVSQSQDNPAEAALMVFVDRTKTPRSMPATVGGLRVRYRVLNPIRVNYSAAARR